MSGRHLVLAKSNRTSTTATMDIHHRLQEGLSYLWAPITVEAWLLGHGPFVTTLSAFAGQLNPEARFYCPWGRGDGSPFSEFFSNLLSQMFWILLPGLLTALSLRT